MNINKAFLNSFSLLSDELYIYINLEVLSGDIEITNSKNEYKFNKTSLISFKIEELNDFSLEIKANIDSIYSISASLHTENIDLLMPQINNLLKINTKTNENSLIFIDEAPETTPYYFGFLSKDCDIEVKHLDSLINGQENFYQDYQNIDINDKSINSFLAIVFRLTVQRYNREIALYEFSGNFFREK